MSEKNKIKLTDPQKTNEKIALSFYIIIDKINQSNLDDISKKDIVKDLSKLQKDLDVKPISEKTITTLKNLGYLE